MTIVADIIKDAFRETNIIPLGASPNAAQSEEALRLLNALIASIYGTTAGEKLDDWALGRYGVDDPRSEYVEYDDWFYCNPHINRRLLITNEKARRVYFSQRPQDGSRMAVVDPYLRASQAPVTLDGNGRPIEGADEVVIDVDGTERTWFYRADKGAWFKLSSLVETDEMPFPADFDTFFTISLAIRINPRYGRNLDDQSTAEWQRSRQNFVNRYLQSLPMRQNPVMSWPFMSLQSYSRYQGGDYGDGGFRSGRVL